MGDESLAPVWLTQTPAGDCYATSAMAWRVINAKACLG